MPAHHGIIGGQDGGCRNQRDGPHLCEFFHSVFLSSNCDLPCSLYYEVRAGLDEAFAVFLEPGKVERVSGNVNRMARFLETCSIACYHCEIAAVLFCQVWEGGGIDALVSTVFLLVCSARYRRVDRAARFRVCWGYASAKIGSNHRAQGYSQRRARRFGGSARQESDDNAHGRRSEPFRPPDARSEKQPPVRRSGR